MEKIWQLAPKPDKKFERKFPEINPVILQLLFNRGLKTQEKIDEFLLPDILKIYTILLYFKTWKKL